MFRYRSIVGRTVALHLVAIVVTSILMPLALYLMLKYAAQDLHEHALREQAAELIALIGRGPDGKLQVRLTPRLADLYSPDYKRYSYAVGDESHVLLSSFSDRRAITRTLPPIGELLSFSGNYDGSEIFGVSVPTVIDGEKLWVEVSQDLAHRDVLIDDIVADFFTRIGWITAPILLLLLAIDVAIIRRAVRPVIAASNFAERIGPLRTDLRLPEPGMPREVQPLVHAVNEALDRLEQGFRVQREFTADAAHELRTPLAILRTQIDMIGDRELALSAHRCCATMSPRTASLAGRPAAGDVRSSKRFASSTPAKPPIWSPCRPRLPHSWRRSRWRTENASRSPGRAGRSLYPAMPTCSSARCATACRKRTSFPPGPKRRSRSRLRPPA